MSKGRRLTTGPIFPPKKLPSEPVFSDHHAIPRSRKGARDGINVLRVYHPFHAELHHLFSNKLPHEQIEIVLRFADKVLTDEFKSRIREVLEMEEKYHPEAFRS